MPEQEQERLPHDLFATNEEGKQCQALSDAIHDCADDDKLHIYEWLNSMPRASLTAAIVEKLNENGFVITNKET